MAEAHRVLTERGLRRLVTLQVDGGCKTGLDVVLAAALGADEVGFGTSLLVAAGCVMARQCHANTCPVGIATQRPDLRRQFAGTPEQVGRYVTMVATHVRRLMAELGVRRFDDLVGRADWLTPADPGRTPPLALTTLLQAPAAGPVGPAATGGHRAAVQTLNDRLVDACLPRLGRAPILWSTPIRNTDLSVGTRLAGVIAERYGDAGSPEPIRVTFSGTAGQSFGAFALPGIHFVLVGQANDGVGKSMHGGVIIVRRAGGGEAGRRTDVLIGNSALYGATGGTLFVAGHAGDRFAVRNSGATALVEGVGDHACEYMTGGLVVVLGNVGRNFCAGLLAAVHRLVTRHATVTGSPVAARLLQRWSRVAGASCVVRAVADVGLRPEVVTTDDEAPWIYANSKS